MAAAVARLIGAGIAAERIAETLDAALIVPVLTAHPTEVMRKSMIDHRNRIAELTKNEAAYVSSGAAAGITLAVATCIAGTDPDLSAAFPYLEGVTKTEVIPFNRLRWYDSPHYQ